MKSLLDSYFSGTLDLYFKYNSLVRIKQEIDDMDTLYKRSLLENRMPYYLRGIKDYLYPRIKAMCYVGIDTEYGHTIGDILKVTFKYVPDPMLFMELVVPSVVRASIHSNPDAQNSKGTVSETDITEIRHSSFLGWLIDKGNMRYFDLTLQTVILSSPIIKKMGALDQYKTQYKESVRDLRAKTVGNDDVNQSLKVLKDNIKREIRDALREAKKSNIAGFDMITLKGYKEQSRNGNIHDLYTTLVDIKTFTLQYKYRD
jgi:hypothetical protein